MTDQNLEPQTPQDPIDIDQSSPRPVVVGKSGNNNKPLFFFALLLPFLFSSGYFAGREIASGEIHQLKAEADSVQKKVLKCKRDVAPNAVITLDDVIEVDVFGNRTAGGEVLKAADAVGHKAHYGMNKDQVVMVRDLD